MLNGKLKGKLPYPPENAAIILYNFLVDEINKKKHEDWILDLGTGEYKYPMTKLNKAPLFWYGTKTNGEVNRIKGTNICWKIESEMFAKC